VVDGGSFRRSVRSVGKDGERSAQRRAGTSKRGSEQQHQPHSLPSIHQLRHFFFFPFVDCGRRDYRPDRAGRFLVESRVEVLRRR
jgi:hypothetical protein